MMLLIGRFRYSIPVGTTLFKITEPSTFTTLFIYVFNHYPLNTTSLWNSLPVASVPPSYNQDYLRGTSGFFFNCNVFFLYPLPREAFCIICGEKRKGPTGGLGPPNIQGVVAGHIRVPNSSSGVSVVVTLVSLSKTLKYNCQG